MANLSEHAEWLNLVDRSGPFLVPAVLDEVFPQGLEKVEAHRRQRLRAAYDEWRDAVDEDDPEIDKLHQAWVRMVIQEALEYEDQVLLNQEQFPKAIIYRSPEHHEEVAPDLAVCGMDGNPRLFIAVYPPDTDLEKPPRNDHWPASAVERMTLLCRANLLRIGLVTNGEQWMLVNAPVGSTSGYVSWLARLWWQEPVTLRAFVSLIGVRRCFGPAEDTLAQLLERSIVFQEEVTDTLGEQVRQAVEVLIQALGRVDEDRNGELLRDVSPTELYEAGLTIMMRLVFILCAEERGLLLLGDPIYDQDYAISTLRARLREDESQHGPEVLERRYDAWSRVLSVFRVVYGGIDHEVMRMPALGGSLFDPDRFPFLEGRTKGTSWREHPAAPLPIDNRTVLLLLTALQVLEQHGGAQLLSYRALDVEQVGHVYEGLLEYTAARLPEVTVGLIGSQRIRHPTISLSDLEGLSAKGTKMAAEQLADLTGRSLAATQNALDRGRNDADFPNLIHACGGDESLATRLLPFAAVIRTDSWGAPLVYQAGSFAVVRGADRRETGTHYTPRSLTESIVEQTLDPIIYEGVSDGKPRDEWKLRTPAELVDLKICDPAMGSGAFLVQACRYLAECLVESWALEESRGRAVTVDGIVVTELAEKEPLSKSLDDRLLIARRLIAERCLYGVDLNPLAVELAKLSIWLVTLAKGRPFGFLDHNLRCGDSLLGIHKLDQLVQLDLNPELLGRQRRLFGQSIQGIVEKAIELRQQLWQVRIRDIYDIEKMASLDAQARGLLQKSKTLADALIAEAFRSCGDNDALKLSLDSLAMKADHFLNGDEHTGDLIRKSALDALCIDLPSGKPIRRPFHWPLEFPEVFMRDNPGFDAIIGNPPFRGGLLITKDLGAHYSQYLKESASVVGRTIDLCAFFFRRAFTNIRQGGISGLLATNSISKGDTRQAALEPILTQGGHIIRAWPSIPWPGSAAVHISPTIIIKGSWHGDVLLGDQPVKEINSYLQPGITQKMPGRLYDITPAFLGTTVYGEGFFIDEKEKNELLNQDASCARVVRRFLNGNDVLKRPIPEPTRYVLFFQGMSLSQATQYKSAYEIIRQRVYPERQKSSSKRRREAWWLYTSPAEELYRSISGLDHVFVTCFTSKYVVFTRMESDMIFSNAVVVISSEDYGLFAVLQSSFHEAWVHQYSSTLETRQRYALSDCYETFPPPELITAQLRSTGQRLHDARSMLMAKSNQGLTDIYNRIHDANDQGPEIETLRKLHIDIDYATAAAYRWEDVDLQHKFYETDQGLRFTISGFARDLILKRLLEVNHARRKL